MKVLITGATGFLGSHLLAGLLRHGHEVVALKRSFSDTRRIRGLLDATRFYDADVSPLQRPWDEQGGIDAVVHAATRYGRDGDDADEIVRSNVVFPLSLMQVAAERGCPLFINTDTFFNTPAGGYGYLADYTASKRRFQEAGERAGNDRLIRFVNLRVFHVYGPGDDPRKFTTSIVRRCLSNEPAIDLTAGGQRRDFIHVSDVVDAFLAVLERAAAGPEGYRSLDVGTGRSVPVRVFAETAHRLAGSSSRLNFGALPYRPGEFEDARADASALSALGWQPAVNLEDGIRTIIAEARTRHDNT